MCWLRVVVVLGVSSSEAAVGRGFVYVDIYLNAMCLVRVSTIVLAVYAIKIAIKIMLEIAAPSKLGAPSSMPVLRPLGIASELRRMPSELEHGKVVML